MHLKISKVAKELNIAVPTIRYYDELGLLRLKKVNGVRQFTDEDVQKIRCILHCKELGFSLAQLKTVRELEYAENRNQAELVRVRTDLIREKLEELRSLRKQIDENIEDLEQIHKRLECAEQFSKEESGE